MIKYFLIASLMLDVTSVVHGKFCHPIKVNLKLNQLTSYAISSIMNQIATNGEHSNTFTVYIIKNDNCFECFTDLLTKIMKKLNISINIIIQKDPNFVFFPGSNTLVLNDYFKLSVYPYSPNPTYRKSFILAYNGYISQQAENLTVVNNNVDAFEKVHLYHSKDMQSLFFFSNVFDDATCHALLKKTNIFNMTKRKWDSNDSKEPKILQENV